MTMRVAVRSATSFSPVALSATTSVCASVSVRPAFTTQPRALTLPLAGATRLILNFGREHPDSRRHEAKRRVASGWVRYRCECASVDKPMLLRDGRTCWKGDLDHSRSDVHERCP